MARRIFYVLYFENPSLQRALDAIRFILNPKEKNRAHITVRGPYNQRYSLKSATRRIGGSQISVLGVGNFFDARQNTVYLKCGSEELKAIWKKRDFGFYPHITLYDGDSRQLARDLVSRIAGLDLSFCLKVDGLHPLVSSKGQGDFDLQQAFDEEFISELLGEPIAASSIETFEPHLRLATAEALTRQLAALGSCHDSVGTVVKPLGLAGSGTVH